MRPCLWLLLSLACACASDNIDPTDAYSIDGLVLDEFSEDGISGATIRFVSDTLDRAETTSEADGGFVLRVEITDGVRFGTIQASREGYATSAKSTVYFDGLAPRVELRLRPER